MKRLTATLLAAAMCMGTFAGCGSNTEETTDNPDSETSSEEEITAMQVQQQARQQLLLRRARQLPLRMCIWMR